MNHPLKFGIRGLDELIDTNAIDQKDEKDEDATDQGDEKDEGATWSVAIVGPDGCGKSILALHLASNYHDRLLKNWKEEKKKEAEKPANGDGPHSPCNVLYVSTDLSFQQAKIQWESFGLDRHLDRLTAIQNAYRWRMDILNKPLTNNSPPADKSKNCRKLQHVMPRVVDQDSDADLANSDADLAKKSLSQVFPLPYPSSKSGTPPESKTPSVFFVDLERETAGDDWGFINHLLGLLDKPEDQAPELLSNVVF